jgi:hypothetical protein
MKHQIQTAAIAFLIFLSTLCSAQHSKPYVGYIVTVTETRTNSNGVRIIRGYEEQLNFLFQCNANDVTCRALMIGRTYMLTNILEPGHYDCDNYTLRSEPFSPYDFADVCLDDVEASGTSRY